MLSVEATVKESVMETEIGFVPEFLVVHKDDRAGTTFAYIVNLN